MSVAGTSAAATATRRKQLGAWYTPPELIDRVLDEVLDPLIRLVAPGDPITVLDPACGDGRFLAAAEARIRRAGRRPELTGVDIDRGAARATRAALGPGATVTTRDALRARWPERTFDVVIGNPPFLSQLASATARGGRSSHGGGPYADAAVEFLALALRLARPDGGRIGLVLPTSIVATRDAAAVRTAVLDSAALSWFWWSPTPVFDAQVRTCAVALVRGASGRAAPRRIRRLTGPGFRPCPAVAAADFRRAVAETGSWSWLLRDEGAAPALPELATSSRVLADLASVTADFRDEYYGLVGAVSDASDDDGGGGRSGPPLVTSGLIDPGRCLWGERSTRFAKQRFDAPLVHLGRLSPRVLAWATERLVPKVLVASQTRIIEAVADLDGAWLPCVPVVSVTPRKPNDVRRVAALLTSPVASAWLAARSAGTGLSARALRVSAPVLAQLPLPRGKLDAAAACLERGDVEGCGSAVSRAYGLDDEAGRELLAWWLSGARVQPG
ncbi:MAG: N-6 DNA methylase [Acidimicrobiia bacterium]